MKMIVCLFAVLSVVCLTTSSASAQVVTAPPESYFEKVRERDREAARAFYTKHVDIHGVHCTSSQAVDDRALLRTHEIVTHMLAGRPDVLEAMARFGTRLIVIGKDQVYTDMPEYRNHPNPSFQNERVRGTGGLDVTSFGEENLLNLALDRYDDESIAVHEFCHTIDAALSRIDPSWRSRRDEAYRQAVASGLYKYAYAGGNPAEYWAEISQAYFDCNRINNWNHAAVGTREQLQEYDPVGFELVRSTFKLTHENDWRFVPLQIQPSVITPPDRFHFDPFYRKFTWAREFPIVASAQVDDRALLRANQVVRKVFAYRHDLLKTLINDGGKLVVLARGETLTDLPEFQAERESKTPAQSRFVHYSKDRKTIVVPEENLLDHNTDIWQGKCLLVGAMARAVFTVAAAREVDEKFTKVRGDSQQYEQRLLWKSAEPIARMDITFDVRVRELAAQASEKGLWKGTPAARGHLEYWTTGVEAYFNATGHGYPPTNAAWPVTNREQLERYDPALYQLVHDTMLYAGHQDWRVK